MSRNWVVWGHDDTNPNVAEVINVDLESLSSSSPFLNSIAIHITKQLCTWLPYSIGAGTGPTGPATARPFLAKVET